MGFFDSKSDSKSTTKTSVIDTAENFAEAEAGQIINLNLAGAKVGTASRGAQIGGQRGGHKNAGGGGVSPSNSGVMFNLLDKGAIDKSFGLAQMALIQNSASNSKTIEAFSAQLSEKRSTDDAALIDTQGLRQNVLYAVGFGLAAWVAVKLWGNN